VLHIRRIRVGNRQTLETLINDKALLFAKYSRKEKENMDSEGYSFASF